VVSADEHPVPPEDQALYAQVLMETVTRIQGARTYLSGDPTRATIEYAALQMRMTLELIVMGSLVTNRAAVGEIASALAKKKVDEARKLAKRANPDYWPKPVRIQKNVMDGTTLVGALTEQAWSREWGVVSDLLHARNPFRPSLNEHDAHEGLVRLMREVMALLNSHVVRLAHTEYLLVGQIDETGAHVTPFQRAE
jgi:hypothetical protein